MYDKLMLGLLFTNYKLPPDPLQFFIAPFYATSTKTLTGLGKINYSLYTNGWIRRTDLFVNGSSFTMNDFTDSSGKRLSMRFRKLVPGIRFTLGERDPRSTFSRYVQWKTFLFREDFLAIGQDSTFANGNTTVHTHFGVEPQFRYVNQLRLAYGNFRALYPYDLSLQIDQSADFIRPTFTANYFFNYGGTGGLQLRFFAGKFLYLGGKTLEKSFRNDRYFLNLTGPNGLEDYTYSNYFLGRNRFDGLASQQIMIGDGAFKMRSDLLLDKIGKTDNWLSAVNLRSSLPQSLNPFPSLPIKIPIQLFCDIGTYADTWDRTSTADRFVYDAGIQLPLFKGIVNIYIPVLYSRVFRDYVKSYLTGNKFFKTVSFSIDLNSRQLKSINPEIEL